MIVYALSKTDQTYKVSTQIEKRLTCTIFDLAGIYYRNHLNHALKGCTVVSVTLKTHTHTHTHTHTQTTTTTKNKNKKQTAQASTLSHMQIMA